MNPPHLLPRTPHAKAAWARRHPMERQYVGRSVGLSVAIHVLLGAMVCLLALWLDQITFNKSSSREQSGPAPAPTVTMIVMPEAHPPSPPTPSTPKPTPEQGLPVLPIVQTAPKPPTVTLVPPPKPVPKPSIPPVAPAVTQTQEKPPAPSPTKTAAKPKPRPKYVAAHATGQGTAPDISSQQVAKLGYPAPNYPQQAQSMHETGTVLMEVSFGPDGRVTDAQVQKSSGFAILDFSTRRFIRVHWKDLGRANTSLTVPVIYNLP